MHLCSSAQFHHTLLKHFKIAALSLSMGLIYPIIGSAEEANHQQKNDTVFPNNVADTVLLNGYIYTAEPSDSRDKDHDKKPEHYQSGNIVQSLAIRGKKIIFVGSDKDAQKHIGQHTKVFNLNGKMVLPGFIDTHTHLELFSGSQADGIDLSAIYSTSGINQALQKFALDNPGKASIRGSGYSRVYYVKETGDSSRPNAADLDAIIPDRPAAIFEINAHSMWLNTKALQLLGITKDTPDPKNGFIERYANNEPTGQISDNAIGLVTNGFPKAPKQAFQDTLLKNIAYFNANGVTGIFEAMNSSYGNIATQNYYHSATQELAAQDKLNVRLRGSWYINPADASAPALSPKAQIDLATANSENFNSSNGLFRTETLKFFIDGSLEGGSKGTALMLKPFCPTVMYSCAGTTSTANGFDFWANAGQDLVQALKDANQAKFHIHIHTIGDGAVRKAAQAVEQAGIDRSMHPTLAHMQLSEPEDIARMAKVGIEASLSFRWMDLDSYFSGFYYPFLGFDRAYNQTYDLQSLFDAGINVTAGSDWSVTNPEYEIQTFVGLTRLMPKKLYTLWYGDPAIYPYIADLGHVFQPSEFDTVNFSTVPIGPLPPFTERAKHLEDLINAYTINAAKQLSLDKDTGSIAVGKSADLVVWNDNWFPYAQKFAKSNDSQDLEPIANSSVMYTLFQGKLVYDFMNPIAP